MRSTHTSGHLPGFHRNYMVSHGNCYVHGHVLIMADYIYYCLQFCMIYCLPALWGG